MTEKLTIIQWNARGLTKARLEEFRNYLSSFNLHIVLLNETFWRNIFEIKFIDIKFWKFLN